MSSQSERESHTEISNAIHVTWINVVPNREQNPCLLQIHVHVMKSNVVNLTIHEHVEPIYLHQTTCKLKIEITLYLNNNFKSSAIN